MGLSSTDVKKLRRKQYVASNLLVLAGYWVSLFIMAAFDFEITTFYNLLGIAGMIQAFVIWMMDSSKGNIPVFSEVARYEKEKLGREWHKQRKVSIFISLIYSLFLFYLAFTTPSIDRSPFEPDLWWVAGFPAILLVVVNVGLYSHTRKIDASTSPDELKGYTFQRNFMGVLAGIIMGIVMVIIIIASVVSII